MNDLIYRLRKRAEIRRNATTRKSVQEGKPDRISDLLEEAADAIESQEKKIKELTGNVLPINFNPNFRMPPFQFDPNQCPKCCLDISGVTAYSCNHKDCPCGLGSIWS